MAMPTPLIAAQTDIDLEDFRSIPEKLDSPLAQGLRKRFKPSGPVL
jgi:hypothetical protein